MDARLAERVSSLEEMSGPENISEEGGLIMNGRGKLVRFESIEASLWDIPVDKIDPNPNQPRVFFDSAKMAELKATIADMGQKVPLNVVPYQVQESGEIRFMIVDGERRYRSLKELEKTEAKAIIEWYPTERKIYEALIFNIDRRGIIRSSSP
jgi:ParB family chromosome partitioning protein